ncbi:MAG: glycosyltransferase family 1 protein [Thermodesulfobacteriota bacterium]|nr:glycosyltransferase family 1 protein [Thermodesulfobacteriota bacterium]
MIKLTIDVRAINNSGIGSYIKTLLPYLLHSEKFDICLLGNKETLYHAGFDDVHVVECRANIYSIKEQIEVPYNASGCEIFWSPHYNIPLLPVRAKKRVVTIHDVYHLAYIDRLKPLEKIYARVVLPMATWLSDKIITVSDFSKKEIVRYTHARPEKINVICNGVEFDRFNNAKANPDLLKRYLLTKYILYVGNVKPHKNIIGLIDAFAILHKMAHDIKLVIVGRKEQFITGIQGLDKYINKLGLEDHVVFTGVVDDNVLLSLYKGAIMFVFPSFYEGFGLPPIEAMASGTPVVASNAASIPEICGDAAVYVDPYNPGDIANGMIKVLEDSNLRDTLVKKGIEKAKAFTWESSASAHIKIFEELARADSL